MMKKIFSNFNDITKEQFVDAYEKYPPNKWVVFFFRYFSKETIQKDKYLTKILQGSLISLFLLGMIGTILNMNSSFIKYVTIIFSLVLGIFVLCAFSAIFLNNYRISKIRKELGGISKVEYNVLVDKYLD